MTAPVRGAGRPGMRPEAAMAVIRIAMLVGVLAFGGVIWLLHRQPGWVPGARTDALPALLRMVPVLQAAIVVGALGLRVATRTAGPERARQLQIMGWALGELAALAGGVRYFLTDDPQWYVSGVIVLLAAYVILPIRRGP